VLHGEKGDHGLEVPDLLPDRRVGEAGEVDDLEFEVREAGGGSRGDPQDLGEAEGMGPGAGSVVEEDRDDGEGIGALPDRSGPGGIDEVEELEMDQWGKVALVLEDEDEAGVLAVDGPTGDEKGGGEVGSGGGGKAVADRFSGKKLEGGGIDMSGEGGVHEGEESGEMSRAGTEDVLKKIVVGSGGVVHNVLLYYILYSNK